MTKCGFIEDMILLIRQAESEALKNNIRANTILLNNKKFGKIKPFYIPILWIVLKIHERRKLIKKFKKDGML